MKSEAITQSSTVRSTRSGSPTKPRSTTSSWPVAGLMIVRLTLRAAPMPPSLPERPMARPPSALIDATICLLIEPARIISTMSTVSLSVTRRPALNSLLMPSRSSMPPICGPPPWTTTGLMPTSLRIATSCANQRAALASPMALPPYFTTTVAAS